jgi:hypothetical protein
MNNYLIIVIGWVLGQAAYACKKSWDLQKTSVSLTFKDTIKIFFTKETASFAFAGIMLLIALFATPDFLNLDITKEELKNSELAKWKVFVINFLRVISVIFGYFCQNIGYFFFGKAGKFIKSKSDADGIDLPMKD